MRPLGVVFSSAAAEAFSELPVAVQRQAERSIRLAAHFPKMYAVRRAGLMAGYRYFISKRHLFYYQFSERELRIAAIIPGPMEAA